MGIYMSLQALKDREIEELAQDQMALQDFIESTKAGDPPGPLIDIFHFHGLHYLFTGSAWKGAEPLCYLVHQNRLLGLYNREHEVRAITSKQLEAFELALQPIDHEELLKRYDGKAMTSAGIYPSIWEIDDNEAKDGLCEDLDKLKSFLKAAKTRQEGALIWTY